MNLYVPEFEIRHSLRDCDTLDVVVGTVATGEGQLMRSKGSKPMHTSLRVSSSVVCKAVKPLLKWPGGKSLELPMITASIPTHTRYFEPFFGGGSVYFDCIDTDVAYANDLHSDLMDFYRAVKSQHDGFFSRLYDFVGEWEKASSSQREFLYYDARRRYNYNEGGGVGIDIERTVCFFLLRELAYGGMFRLNGSGDFNVPFGRVYGRNPGLLRRKTDHLQSLSVQNKLKKLTLYSADFDDFLNQFEFEYSDFMFVDPPYDTTFSSYGEGMNFDKDDQERLGERLYNFPGKFMLVCKLTPLTERLYCSGAFRGLRVQQYDVRYRFNIKGRFSRDSRHLMVTNYG